MPETMKIVFLVGCPRSGTTWLQIIMGRHPRISTVRETHLFDRYVAGLYQQWERERLDPERDGLQGLMQGDDFNAAVREFCNRVLQSIQKRKEGSIVLEKTPAHVFHHALIKRLFPRAMFLHLVRDPRAVVASLLAARREPWGQWAPRDLNSAAQLWREAVKVGHFELAQYGPDFMEVQYEKLLAQPDAELSRIWEWLAIEPIGYDTKLFSIDALKTYSGDSDPLDPAQDDRSNFFRKGSASSWQSELAAADIKRVESVCRDLFAAFGYQPLGEPEAASHIALAGS